MQQFYFAIRRRVPDFVTVTDGIVMRRHCHDSSLAADGVRWQEYAMQQGTPNLHASGDRSMKTVRLLVVMSHADQVIEDADSLDHLVGQGYVETRPPTLATSAGP